MEMNVARLQPRFNVVESIRDLVHEVRLVRSRLEAQIDRLDRIERELVALMGSGMPARRAESGVGLVAHNLEMQPRADGSALVAIDGGRRFVLAPQLAEVFRFLATGDKDRSGSDALVGWRSREEILLFLHETARKDYLPRYVNNLVYRLKTALRKAGYDCSLIQTHRHKGVRVAFKRGAKVMPESASTGW